MRKKSNIFEMKKITIPAKSVKEVGEGLRYVLAPKNVKIEGKNNKDKKQLEKETSFICGKISKIQDKKSLSKIADALISNQTYNQVFVPNEKWKERDKKIGENPVDFINRVYEPVLDGYFTQPDLKAHDPALYTALYNWIRDHNGGERPSLEELNLPTKKELNDRLINASGPSRDLEALQLHPDNLLARDRARGRISDVARKRKARMGAYRKP